MSSEFTKYTFLFTPVDALGHFDSAICVAEQLLNRGHNVVFATPTDWEGKLAPLGIIEECYLTTPPPPGKGANINLFKEFSDEVISKIPPSMEEEERNFQVHLKLCLEGIQHIKYAHAQMAEIVERVKPDVIYLDVMFQHPSLTCAGIPWILAISTNPFCTSSENPQPGFSGYPSDGDCEAWKLLETRREAGFAEVVRDFKNWVVEMGEPYVEVTVPFDHQHSPYANIYMYPIELDCTTLRPNPPNWHQLDALVRSSGETFEIPKQLKNLPGKLVYFSMGSIGCTELRMMQRLITILSKSSNRFIVSKGLLGGQLNLAKNMWGSSSIPQTKVIPMVDLVITYGGNNTITESFYFGKRILILPLFSDQFHNAQRIHETGLGRRCNPFKVTETDLLSTIESLLKDDLLDKRMASISKRIQSSNSRFRAADLVEEVARKYSVK